MQHRVYYLFDPETDQLLYIGRTCNLRERLRYFKKRTGISPVLGVCQRFTDFDEACAAELRAIENHHPKLNRRMISTRGFLGKHTMLGVPKTRETRMRMRKPKSEEHRASMRKPKSPEHKAKLQQAIAYARSCRFGAGKEKQN